MSLFDPFFELGMSIVSMSAGALVQLKGVCNVYVPCVLL